MKTTQPERDNSVSTGLAAAATHALRNFHATRNGSAHRWRFEVDGTTADAAIDADWFAIEASPTSGQSVHQPIDLLRANTGLRQGARYCLGRGALLLRAEVATGEYARRNDIVPRLADAAHGLAEASRSDAPTASGSGAAQTFDPSLYEATGWPFVRRADDVVAFELRVGRRVFAALNDTRCHTLWTPIGSTGDATPHRSEAAALYLLHATASIRSVRAALRDDQIGFETVLPREPLEADLRQALEALWLACDACALEAAALLENDTLAADYCLALWSEPAGSPVSPAVA